VVARLQRYAVASAPPVGGEQKAIGEPSMGLTADWLELTAVRRLALTTGLNATPWRSPTVFKVKGWASI
jgi:hypothetical protein